MPTGTPDDARARAPREARATRPSARGDTAAAANILRGVSAHDVRVDERHARRAWCCAGRFRFSALAATDPPPSCAPRLATPESFAAARARALAAIDAGAALSETHLGVGSRYGGKVRDVYTAATRVAIVTSDRLSAFDRLLAAVPFKGAVLNGTSAWWFRATAHIVPNHLLGTPHANLAVVRRARPFLVEVVVRAYMTGSTSTSIWSHYAAGAREYCGHALPEGLKKSQRLPATIVTPTTKEEAHDRPISGAEVVALGLATADEWAYIEAKALALFAFGEAVARERGLILVDTKYEFGRDVETGEVMVIDEMHTPDSSRYWLADSYAARVAAGAEPDNVDKEFLRLWFRAHCDPYADARLPPAPRELVAELSARYTKLYELITGETFVPPPGSVGEGGERAAAGAAGGAGVEAAVAAALGDALPRAAAALVVVDTDGEPRTAADAAAAGAAAGVASEYHAGSVVTASARLIELYAALGARPAAAGASAGAGAGARAAAAPVFAVAVTGGAWAAATAAHAAALFRGPVLLVGPPAAAAEAGGRVRAVGSLADAVAAAAEAAAAAPATTAPAAAAPAAT